jgi:hypothetical protein
MAAFQPLSTMLRPILPAGPRPLDVANRTTAAATSSRFSGRIRMTSEPIRDPLTDSVLTPQNAALVIIDYQPSQNRRREP